MLFHNFDAGIDPSRVCVHGYRVVELLSFRTQVFLESLVELLEASLLKFPWNLRSTFVKQACRNLRIVVIAFVVLVNCSTM